MTTPISRHAQRGFTLIELLVVITIIGIMSSLLVLSVKSTQRQDSVQKWLEQLDEKVSYTLDVAVLSNKPYAIQFNKAYIRFLKYENNTKKSSWTMLEDGPLKQIKVPDTVSINLYVNGATFVMEDTFEKIQPDVLIDSLATITPFELQLHHEDKTYIVKYDAVGKVSHETR